MVPGPKRPILPTPDQPDQDPAAMTLADRPLPLRAGTRGSPLALFQTRLVMRLLAEAGPRDPAMFEESRITTTGDQVQDRRLAEIGGKGLFAKEIHEALADRRVDFAVHSLKDLETELPPGIVLAAVLKREDPRDTFILGPSCHAPDPAAPLACLPKGAVIGTSSVRRQAQLLHARPDLAVVSIRGNVRTRMDKLAAGDCAATLLAYAGLRRLGFADEASVILEPETMLPAACQGIVGITARADDAPVLAMLKEIEDPDARDAAAAERGFLGELDGSCRTPLGALARRGDDGRLTLTGLVARADGSFLLRREITGSTGDAARMGADLGRAMRAESPRDVFA